MTNKAKLTGAALALGLALVGPANADLLDGKIYQVADGDVYITLEDSTVVRVPVETATFTVEGRTTPYSALTVGQQVIADYTPVYGFQRYYHTNSDTAEPRTVYIIQDIDPNDASILEWDGQVYHIVR